MTKESLNQVPENTLPNKEKVVLLCANLDISEKKAKKLAKGFETRQELNQLLELSKEDLEKGIADREQECENLLNEMEKNAKYTEAEELVKDFKASFRETTAPLKAKAKLLLFIRESK